MEAIAFTADGSPMKDKNTLTGRLDDPRPNLQNVPIRTEEGRRIRDAFRVWDGLPGDYIEIEKRLMKGDPRDP